MTLTSQTRLRPNVQEVAAKVMDGEAIMINLANGMYYSTDRVGGFIWEMVEARYSLEEMAEAITARYDIPADRARADTEQLAGQFLEEKLALVADDEKRTGEVGPPEAQQKAPYTPPQLTIHRDMADLLALDPPMPGLEDTTWTPPGEDAPG